MKENSVSKNLKNMQITGAPNEKILLQVSEHCLYVPFVRFKGLFLNAKKNVDICSADTLAELSNYRKF